MKHTYLLLVIFASLLSVSLMGCGPSKPDGIGKIRPFQIKVVNNSAPVEGVKVSLFSETLPSGAVVFGDTDASGIAVFFTVTGTWKAQGVPEGDYKVTLKKYADIKYEMEHSTTDDNLDKATMAKIQKYDAEYNAKVEEIEKIVPFICRGVDKTPVTVKVNAETSSFDVDLSKYK